MERDEQGQRVRPARDHATDEANHDHREHDRDRALRIDEVRAGVRQPEYDGLGEVRADDAEARHQPRAHRAAVGELLGKGVRGREDDGRRECQRLAEVQGVGAEEQAAQGLAPEQGSRVQGDRRDDDQGAEREQLDPPRAAPESELGKRRPAIEHEQGDRREPDERLDEAPYRRRREEVRAVCGAGGRERLRQRPPDKDGGCGEHRRERRRARPEPAREQVDEEDADEHERRGLAHDRRDPDQGHERERRQPRGEGDARPSRDPARPAGAGETAHAALPCPAARPGCRGRRRLPDTTKRPKEPLWRSGRTTYPVQAPDRLSMRASTGPP